MPQNANETYEPLTFDAIRIGLASPERILEWSHGEVKKPETINYRTLKPEKDGLYCERIFGPSKDWECHCGKYKKIRYKGVICDRCGVEVTKASVRRERMGHVKLSAPVSHIWYFKGIPSRMGLILDLSPRVLEKVLYFASYIVLDPGTTDLQKKQVLSEKEYRDNCDKWGYGSFRVGMGAEAIQELLKEIDLEKDSEELMDELVNIKDKVRPQEILLVIDAMTGQDAVNVAESFNEKLGIDGVIVTKLDGDTRGGAALSVRAVTGKPIKYVGMGEKMEDLEPFYPDRMASRILGMGDVLSLIEKAQQVYDDNAAKELEKKMMSQEFNFDDFLNQINQVKKMGPLKDLFKMIPGAGNLKIDEMDIDDNATKGVEAIITSMTKEERRNPDILNGSRKKRIAKGSGRTIQEVNQLLKQFEEMKKMMKMFGDMTKGKKGRFKLPFF